jgi:hypothetical protein
MVDVDLLITTCFIGLFIIKEIIKNKNHITRNVRRISNISYTFSNLSSIEKEPEEN